MRLNNNNYNCLGQWGSLHNWCSWRDINLELLCYSKPVSLPAYNVYQQINTTARKICRNNFTVNGSVVVEQLTWYIWHGGISGSILNQDRILCHMTSLKVHNVLQCHQRRTKPRPQLTYTKNSIKNGHVVFDMQARRYTYMLITILHSCSRQNKKWK